MIGSPDISRFLDTGCSKLEGTVVNTCHLATLISRFYTAKFLLSGGHGELNTPAEVEEDL